MLKIRASLFSMILVFNVQAEKDGYENCGPLSSQKQTRENWHSQSPFVCTHGTASIGMTQPTFHSLQDMQLSPIKNSAASNDSVFSIKKSLASLKDKWPSVKETVLDKICVVKKMCGEGTKFVWRFNKKEILEIGIFFFINTVLPFSQDPCVESKLLKNVGLLNNLFVALSVIKIVNKWPIKRAQPIDPAELLRPKRGRIPKHKKSPQKYLR